MHRTDVKPQDICIYPVKQLKEVKAWSSKHETMHNFRLVKGFNQLKSIPAVLCSCAPVFLTELLQSLEQTLSSY